MINTRKVIIITSNEELIDQISSKTSEDTHIINFDETNSISKDNKNNNNFFDLSFLAQLSELNPNNDQMYKRVLHSPEIHRSKIIKTSKKPIDLICIICGDRAIGFNYDVLTCASCKAFFRRNAQYHLKNLRCLTGENQCLISHKSARKCQRCRLEKCFNLGMRKDFILSEEEKQKRRQRLEENRQLSHEYQFPIKFHSPLINEQFCESIEEIDRLMDTENDNNIFQELDENEKCSRKSLSIEDWLNIENLKKSYKSCFENRNVSINNLNMSDHISALISWSEFATQRALNLIHFFKQIDEFENLNIDDQFVLIKYNLLPLYLLQRCLNYNLLTGTFGNLKDEDRLKRRQFYNLCYGTSGIRESFMNLMRSLSIVTEQDSTLINLLLIILLFSKGLSMNENEPLLKDILSVHRAQSHYIRLTWNYLIYKHGEKKTSKQFIELLTEISRIQSLTTHFKNYFHSKFQTTNTLERFAPLMHAVLDIY